MPNTIIYRDPNITVFQSTLFQLNSTVVITTDTVLVVDPGYLPEEVDAIATYAQRMKGDRQLFLVFTHADYDHIAGYGAFKPDKVFASEAFAQRTDKKDILLQLQQLDEQFYIRRPYPVTYPEVDFQVYRDGAQYRNGQTKMTFYLTPGHTIDGMMVIIWQLGLCIAGDYLSALEFPFVGYSSVEYERTLEKMLFIHDRNWFTRLIPGHGDPALSINDWLKRRTDDLNYIANLRESIATGIPFNEETLKGRFDFPLMQRPYHEANIALFQQEYEQGLWTWDPDRDMAARMVPIETNEEKE
jgi:hydroxyacylglutathione hydrolase